MNDKPLVIKRRGDDGTRIISVRLKEEMIQDLDRIAKESNYSRNELISLFLKYGISNVIIEEE